MFRTTTGTPVAPRRRAAVGTALLCITGLVGSGLALASGESAPTVTAVTAAVGNDPAVGPLAGGSSAVRVTGTNLTAATSFWFGAVQSTRYVVESDTLAYVTPPAVEDATKPATYNVDVTVNEAGQTRTESLADDYTYTAGPVLTEVRTVDKNVEISGSQLLGATAVLFGDILVKVDTKKLPATASKVTVKAPSLKGGSYSVSVVSPNGIGTKLAAWGAAPVLSKLVLASEYGTKTAKAVTRASAATGTVATAPAAADATRGTALIAVGSGFTDLTGITFGKAPASFVVLDDSTVRLLVPRKSSEDALDSKTGVTASVSVVATNAAGSAKGLKFQYDALPTISSISDVVGNASSATNSVVIKGTHLDKAKVKFGAVAGRVTGTSTELTVVVGKGLPDSTGDIVVTTVAGSVTAPVKYTWKAVDTTTPYPAA